MTVRAVGGAAPLVVRPVAGEGVRRLPVPLVMVVGRKNWFEDHDLSSHGVNTLDTNGAAGWMTSAARIFRPASRSHAVRSGGPIVPARNKPGGMPLPGGRRARCRRHGRPVRPPAGIGRLPREHGPRRSRSGPRPGVSHDRRSRPDAMGTGPTSARLLAASRHVAVLRVAVFAPGRTERGTRPWVRQRVRQGVGHRRGRAASVRSGEGADPPAASPRHLLTVRRAG